MSGKNVSLFELPQGITRMGSQYSAGRVWWNGNLVRWYNKMLVPIGGWVEQYQFPPVTPFSDAQAIRNTHSWRDLLKKPWAAYGSASELWATAIEDSGDYTFYNITPADLGWNPGGGVGYGSGDYSMGPYGISASGGIDLDSSGLWSLDNFGKMLVGVASQDGRLVVWDPVTPTVPATSVVEAPVDNALVIATDEEFLMVMGGKNNPRRIKWASRRTYTIWNPAADNSAGGFDLQTNGVIIGACRVPGGILVLTDTDAHVIEYVGAPYYYGRRRVSDETELTSADALIPMPFGAAWMGQSSFWMYTGNVSKLPCSVELEAFENSSLSSPHLVHGGINQHNQEAWWFYPSQDSAVPNRYVAFSYNQASGQYWTMGEMTRTAWLNPVWQDKPIGVNDRSIYAQETGDTADGLPRNAFAETGALEIGDGDTCYRIDRVYPDVVNRSQPGQPATNINMSFKLKQAPNAQAREYGPVAVSNASGYQTVRMRARQITMRVEEVAIGSWALGKTRLRIKEAGNR